MSVWKIMKTRLQHQRKSRKEELYKVSLRRSQHLKQYSRANNNAYWINAENEHRLYNNILRGRHHTEKEKIEKLRQNFSTICLSKKLYNYVKVKRATQDLEKYLRIHMC